MRKVILLLGFILVLILCGDEQKENEDDNLWLPDFFIKLVNIMEDIFNFFKDQMGFKRSPNLYGSNCCESKGNRLISCRICCPNNTASYCQDGNPYKFEDAGTCTCKEVTPNKEENKKLRDELNMIKRQIHNIKDDLKDLSGCNLKRKVHYLWESLKDDVCPTIRVPISIFHPCAKIGEYKYTSMFYYLFDSDFIDNVNDVKKENENENK